MNNENSEDRIEYYVSTSKEPKIASTDDHNQKDNTHSNVNYTVLEDQANDALQVHDNVDKTDNLSNGSGSSDKESSDDRIEYYVSVFKEPNETSPRAVKDVKEEDKGNCPFYKINIIKLKETI